MPKTWLYYIALALPLVLRVLVFNTGFVESLWYKHYEEAYYLLSRLRVHPLFISLIGNWSLPVFIITVGCYWNMQEDHDTMPQQFLMLPFVYIPFVIVGDYLYNGIFQASSFYVYPLLVLPFGYLYIFAWALFIWIMEKTRLVL